MSKNTSIALNNHFQGFISDQIEDGQFSSASEVVRAGLRLLEERADKLKYLRQELEKGEIGEAISIDDYKNRFAVRREQYLAKQGVNK